MVSERKGEAVVSVEKILGVVVVVVVFVAATAVAHTSFFFLFHICIYVSFSLLVCVHTQGCF